MRLTNGELVERGGLFPFFKSGSILSQHQEIWGMPWRSLAPGTCLVVELDASGLVIHFQHITITLHRVDAPQLHMLAFKLDGAPHFHARVAPAHIGGTATHPTLRLRLANALDIDFGLRSNVATLAPSAKFLIGEPGHRVFFPLFISEKRVGTSRKITAVGRLRQVYQRLLKETSFHPISFRLCQISLRYAALMTSKEETDCSQKV